MSMKKIMLILFLFLSVFTCYITYKLTINKTPYYLSIGDKVADNPYLLNNPQIIYNNCFINKDYRIIDLVNTIKYNEEIEVDNKLISIHQLLKKSDILILSIGNNDIYSKINTDTKEIYTYLNKMINDTEYILDEINRYDYQRVYVLGYYNITLKNNDLFTYINFKLKKITEARNYTFIDLNNLIKNNPKYLIKENNYLLNESGYRIIYNILKENNNL